MNLATERSSQNRHFRIGQFFKRYRLASCHTVAELADILGIESKLFQTYEDGQQMMPINLIFVLSNTLSIPPDEIVDLLYEAYLEQIDRS